MFEQIDRKLFFKEWPNELLDQSIEYYITVGGKIWWVLIALAEKQFRNLEMEGL